MTRRSLLKSGAGTFAATVWPLHLPQAKGKVRIAVIADVHHDIMHDAMGRLETFLKQAEAWKADAVLELGDFCTPKPANRPFADRFERFPGKTFHVIGNHETDGGFSREDVVKFHRMPARYYSFDLKGLHGVVLDGNDVPANHKGGYPSHIGEDQIAWLREDLAKTDSPVVVFSHQSLERPSCVKSQAQLRAVLEAAKRKDGTRKVAACLNGHWHIDHMREIEGIPYVHVNSASYYWVGDQFRRERYGPEVAASHPVISATAPYRDPLFTLLELDFDRKTFTLLGRKTEWVGPSPQELGYAWSEVDPTWIAPRCSDRSGRF